MSKVSVGASSRRWKFTSKRSPFSRSPPRNRHSNHAVCQSPERPSDPVLLAMMSHSGMNLKSSWRMPSAWGRGMKLVWPVVSQIPVRRTKPSGGVNPGSIRYTDTSNPVPPGPAAAGPAPPAVDGHRRACRIEPNPSRIEHLHPARRPEVEQPTRFQEKLPLLGKEKGKAGQVDYLLIDLDLGEIGACSEIGRDCRRHRYLHIETGLSPQKRIPDLRAGAVVFRRGGSSQDIRVRLDIV